MDRAKPALFLASPDKVEGVCWSFDSVKGVATRSSSEGSYDEDVARRLRAVTAELTCLSESLGAQQRT